jgi:hypothetical protein
MKEISLKVAIGAVTAMAAGIGSILGSEGAKAGIKALLDAKKTPEVDPVGDLPEPETDIPITTEATEIETPEMEEGTEVEVNLEDGA